MQTSDPQSSGLVLVIDDDAQVLDLLRRELSAVGCRVTTTATNSEALPLARALRPDIITLDIMMSGGWSVLTALKSDPELAAIPVVILGVIPEVGLTFHLEVADYLVKPIEGDRLTAALVKVRKPANASVLVVTNDLPEREVLRRLIVQSKRTVTVATDGIEALFTIHDNRPGLLVLDLTLPGADVLQVLQALRATERWRAIPVVGLMPADLSLEQRRSLDTVVQHLLAKGGLRIEAFARHLQNTFSHPA
jgi:adenylate cyclase